MAAANPITERARARFWSKITKDGPQHPHRPELGPCWPWSACSLKQGYGRIKVAGKLILSHRLAWMVVVGEVPDGKLVLHSCDNPPCCNPEHLFLGTVKDNTHDMLAKGRKSKHSGGRARITWELVDAIRETARSQPGLSQGEIGRRFGLSQVHVSQIVLQKIWRDERRPQLA